MIADPLADAIRDGDTVFVVPHGVLHSLPLHALRLGGRHLIERCPIAYLPAAFALPTLIDSVVGPPRSPAVIGAEFVEEALKIADLLGASRLLIDERVDRNSALKALERADLIHISAHGYFLEREPERSGWILNPSTEILDYIDRQAGPDFLRARDQLFDMAMKDSAHRGLVTVADLETLSLKARLVTLSSCDSGLVLLDPADDPVGLVPVLLMAGVPTILGSLWRVDSVAAERAMVAFYSYLIHTSNGWTHKPQALQAATLAVMREHPDPYDWAPFVLVGGAAPGVAEPAEA